MLKSLLGIAPQVEEDGSYRPSKLAMQLATSDVTDYAPEVFEFSPGERNKILVVFTENKNMTMQNGLMFSTGNHPVESLLPMLQLKNAGFDFEIATPTGKPVVFEMWAMPTKDTAVMSLYENYKSAFDAPVSLTNVVNDLPDGSGRYAAVFVPGGHGAMLGLPDDPNMGTVLRWAHSHGVFTVSICHGPGALLATALEENDFLYSGYEMAVFPDAVDKKTPMIGYLPGHMPWQLCAKLESLGAIIVNSKGDDSVCVDRTLITGASPAASQKLGVVAARVLLQHLGSAMATTGLQPPGEGLKA